MNFYPATLEFRTWFWLWNGSNEKSSVSTETAPKLLCSVMIPELSLPICLWLPTWKTQVNWVRLSFWIACFFLLIFSNLFWFALVQLGLFQRVVLSGGTAYSPFALDYFPTYQTELLSMQLGCSDQRFNYRDLVQCLRELSADRLVQAVQQIKSEITTRDTFLTRIQLDFRPVIDSNRTYPLFSQDPVTMLESGKWIIFLLCSFWNFLRLISFTLSVDASFD